MHRCCGCRNRHGHLPLARVVSCDDALSPIHIRSLAKTRIQARLLTRVWLSMRCQVRAAANGCRRQRLGHRSTPQAPAVVHYRLHRGTPAVAHAARVAPCCRRERAGMCLCVCVALPHWPLHVRGAALSNRQCFNVVTSGCGVCFMCLQHGEVMVDVIRRAVATHHLRQTLGVLSSTSHDANLF